MTSFHNLVILSNLLFPVYIEETERRFSCFKISDKYAKDREYHTHMAKYFRWENAARSGRAIYAYLRKEQDPQFELGAEFITPELEAIRRTVAGTVDNVIQWLHTAADEKLFLPRSEKQTGHWVDDIYYCYLHCQRPTQQRVLPQPEFTARFGKLVESIGVSAKPIQIAKIPENSDKRQNKGGYRLCLKILSLSPKTSPSFKF